MSGYAELDTEASYRLAFAGSLLKWPFMKTSLGELETVLSDVKALWKVCWTACWPPLDFAGCLRGDIQWVHLERSGNLLVEEQRVVSGGPAERGKLACVRATF